MKKFISLSLVLLCTVFFVTEGYPFKLGGKDLERIGTGNRTMRLIGSVYRASLWVPEEFKGKTAEEIIEANVPSAVIITITSRLISRDRFVGAVSDGFEKVAAVGYKTDQSDDFLDLFDGVEISNGDRINLYYVPGTGVRAAIRSGDTGETENLGTVPGLDFKKALYAIWLGPDPVQESLKKGMLGN